MVKINLLPVKAKQRQYTVVYQLVVGGVVLGIVLFGALVDNFMLKRDQAKLEGDRDALNKEIAELNRLIGEVRQFEEKKAELERKLGVINSLKNNKIGPVHLLEELSVTIPKKVWLSSIKETTLPPDGHSIALIGEAISDETIAEFMSKLEESEFFSNVNLIESRAAGEKAGVPVHAFSLTCEMRVPSKKPPTPEPPKG